MKGNHRVFFVTLPKSLGNKIEAYCKEKEITFNRFFRDVTEAKLKGFKMEDTNNEKV